MQFIQSQNAAFVQHFIEMTCYGSLRIHHPEIEPARLMVGTLFVENERHLWCFCEDNWPLAVGKLVPVSLRYVSRYKDVFMKVSGHAVLVRVAIENQMEGEDAVDTHGSPFSLIKVTMRETVYYTRNNGEISFYAMTG